MNRIALIAGPTGTGKTKVATRLARDWGAVLLPIDQLHMYKDLEVGTNLDRTHFKGLRTHGYQILSPWEVFGPVRYVSWLKGALLDYCGKYPVVIEGGCTSYLKELLIQRDSDPMLKNIEVYVLGIAPDEEHRRSKVEELCSSEKIEEIVSEIECLRHKGFYDDSGYQFFEECETLFKHPEYPHSGLAWALRISAGVYNPAHLASISSISHEDARNRIIENVLRIQSYQNRRLQSYSKDFLILGIDQLNEVEVENCALRASPNPAFGRTLQST